MERSVIINRIAEAVARAPRQRKSEPMSPPDVEANAANTDEAASFVMLYVVSNQNRQSAFI